MTQKSNPPVCKLESGQSPQAHCVLMEHLEQACLQFWVEGRRREGSRRNSHQPVTHRQAEPVGNQPPGTQRQKFLDQSVRPSTFAFDRTWVKHQRKILAGEGLIHFEKAKNLGHGLGPFLSEFLCVDQKDLGKLVVGHKLLELTALQAWRDEWARVEGEER